MVHAQFSGVRIGSGIHLTANQNPSVGGSKTATLQNGLDGKAPGHLATEIDITMPEDIDAWNDCDGSFSFVQAGYDISMMVEDCGAAVPTPIGPLFDGLCGLRDNPRHRGRRGHARRVAHGSNIRPRMATGEYLIDTAFAFPDTIAVSANTGAQYHNLAAAIASPEGDSARSADDLARNVPMAGQSAGSSQTMVIGTFFHEVIWGGVSDDLLMSGGDNDDIVLDITGATCHHIMLPHPEIVRANGAEAETFYVGAQDIASLNNAQSATTPPILH
ncbi:Hint domain-containing protein [Paracoccus sp. 1_MG-2023]|uniref:Hint domain-containing protein n=1 Tax=unclassified Paracoccus (in: a-proteobacteria) TaxID=2688777 RepID=UPI001C09D7E2|nr:MULTISPECIES: Hint domain-containing protein [unclassified Paracoccus (in: a-proteobacteria)]MBU2957761.1 Hint domain-containing protein [Paracoccus sp. C2R09]MDO6667391.1 Hint domain-containing protein [Paracoccus sp. 1_MG-2023]